MNDNLIKVRLPIEGMTCTGCEEHVTSALRKSGAQNTKADFRRGEAVFEIEEKNLNLAKEAVRATGYEPGNEAIVINDKELNLWVFGFYGGKGSISYPSPIS